MRAGVILIQSTKLARAGLRRAVVATRKVVRLMSEALFLARPAAFPQLVVLYHGVPVPAEAVLPTIFRRGSMRRSS